MKEQLEIYKKWAPDTALWTNWAKPIVFMNLQLKRSYSRALDRGSKPNWTDYQSNRMIIVDLPEGDSITEGLGLAKIGYRPVPLYNGVPGNQHAVVPMAEIVEGLRYGVAQLEECQLKDTANPAFLLDANRLKGEKKKPGTFDNRWCVVPQDMPSANYLKKHGIKEIVVRTTELQKDLRYILYGYQKQGLAIYLCGPQKKLHPAGNLKPKSLSLFYRFLLLIGLARSASGGFGMSIPEVSSGSGGHRIG